MNLQKINVAIAGSLETDTGQRTSTLFEQVFNLENISIKALYNEDADVSRKIIKEANLEGKLILLDDRSVKKNTENFSGFVTDGLETLLKIKDLAIVIVTEIETKKAAEIMYYCLKNKINVVNLNAVSEVSFGSIFKDLAEKNGIIYSVGAGDEPAVTLELIEQCQKLNFDIICAGKGKNNPMRVHAAPEDYIDTEKKAGVSPRLIVSFVDGTKTMLEMAILSNASGYPIDREGMHGLEINLKEVASRYDLKKNGGVLENSPVIDYTIGDMAPGVFVIVTSKQKSVLKEMNYLKIGTGPNFVLFKPYHLGNLEAALSIFDIFYQHKPTLTVKDKIITSVVAKAKKDLIAGETIERIGERSFYGFAVKNETIKSNCFAPIGLVEGSKVIKAVKKNDIIKMADLDIGKNTISFKLWEMQNNI